jgi:hypothetical protein
MRKKENKPSKNLVQIIRDNPGCIATIDNDHWTLRKSTPVPTDFDDWNTRGQNKWQEEQELATASDNFGSLGDGGYGCGNCYGGDILQALAIIVGIQVESV